MSTYYKYDFISPEPIFAIVKEELSSYFNTGVIDDTMFPIWLKKALDKLGRSSYQILPYMLKLENSEAQLPPDFYAIREAWLCTSVNFSYQQPNFVYQEVATCSTIVGTNQTDAQIYCNCDFDCSTPGIIKVVYKTTNSVLYQFKKQTMLSPGNIDECKEFCSHSSSKYSYDVHDFKFTTNFCDGDVHILYYSNQEDANNNMLIPDNYRIKEWIEAFLKQKAFEQVFNQTTDETFNQSFQKYQFYKQVADSAYVMADVEAKKETIYDKARKTHRLLNRYGKLDIR